MKKLTIIAIMLLTFSVASYADNPSFIDFKKVLNSSKPGAEAQKNLKEGRGIRLGEMAKSRGTSYEFSTSNPMWRSSLEILDFIPLSTVDYSGGLIISDWYNDSSDTKNSFKITVRFLSNEIQSNSLKITVHKKACDINNNVCSVKKVKSKIEEELATSILRNAAEIQKNDKNSKKKKK